jgi:hypothetical protein
MVTCPDCRGARESTCIGRGASGRPITRSGQAVMTCHLAHRMRLNHPPSVATYAKVFLGKQATMKRRYCAWIASGTRRIGATIAPLGITRRGLK